jgi:hypothetical protein
LPALAELKKNELQRVAETRKEEKNGKPNIAPLQPPTLATFRSWGSSAGAGRAGLPIQRYDGSLIFSYRRKNNGHLSLKTKKEEPTMPLFTVYYFHCFILANADR